MRSVAAIDWAAWTPKDVATELFVVRGGQILLIHKKRGLGAGKILGPGGRVDPGETIEAAAIRECQEELGITPRAPRHRGVLCFQFVDGYAVEVHVFTADDFSGEPRETDEAIPLWAPLHTLPYGEMWPDDALWMPLMLAGRPFRGRFVYEGDAMLDHQLVDEDPARRVFAELERLGAPHEVVAHPPVFTVDEAKRHRRPADADADGARHAHVKNLFVKNKKGAMWLITLDEDRKVDLHALGRQIGAGPLSFASPERLRTHLGVEPGSVTPLAALNDGARVVTVVLDASLLDAERVHVHPLTNDRTMALAPRDLVRLLEESGHPPRVVRFE